MSRPRTTGSARRRDETASHETLERILPVDGGQPGDRPPAARNDDDGTLLDLLKMLAQAIVKLPDPDLVILRM